MANEGTLFLDEIGLIPTETQEKILRAVEYSVFERVGGSRPVEVDVRIIGATNADLPAMANEGKFRQDLLDRLSFEVLLLPPLRERAEDIMLLANHFAARMAFELDWNDMPEFSEESIADLEMYQWPGNVRELKNVVERSIYRAGSPRIEEILFDPFEGYSASQSPMPSQEPAPQQSETQAEESAEALSFNESVRQHEITLLKQSLEQAKYNQKHAAKLLSLTYHQFRGLYRKYQDELGE